MIKDDELDTIAEEKNEVVVSEPLYQNEPENNNNDVVINTKFSQQMDVVKDNILKTSADTDNEFVDTIKENIKEAAVKLTEVEKGKAEYQEQQVDYEKEKLETKQKKNEHEQLENKWSNRQKRREYHYEGVKPIMEFVGIESPMNLIFLYFLAIILSPLFLVSKIIKGTFGVLIVDACSKDKSKTAKGFLWVMLCLLAALVVFCLVYLFLKSQGIYIFK